MGFSLWPWEIETVLLCPIYDGWQGNLLPVVIIKLILDIAIVVKLDGHILIVNESVFQSQFFDNVFLNLLIYLSGSRLSMVRDREVIRVV